MPHYALEAILGYSIELLMEPVERWLQRGNRLRHFGASPERALRRSRVHRPFASAPPQRRSNLTPVARKPRAWPEQRPYESNDRHPHSADERPATAPHRPKRPDRVARLTDVLNTGVTTNQHVAHLHPAPATSGTRWRCEHWTSLSDDPERSPSYAKCGLATSHLNRCDPAVSFRVWLLRRAVSAFPAINAYVRCCSSSHRSASSTLQNTSRRIPERLWRNA